MGKFYAEVEGMIVTEPTSREVSGGRTVWDARLASTERKKNKATGEWENGNTIFLTLVDFSDTLGNFVKRDIVTVKGRISLNKYTTKQGAEREELKLYVDELNEVSNLPRT